MAKKVSLFKRVYSWLHLWLGLVAGLLFAVTALTGTLLVFEEEIEELLHHDFYYAAAPTSEAILLPLDELMQAVKKEAGGLELQRVMIAKRSEAVNYIFVAGKEKDERLLMSVNPYTGQIVEVIHDKDRFFRIVENLHRFLLMDKTGKTITGIACISYIVILLTGLMLWWPNNRKTLKQRLKIKWDASTKRLNWDIHAVGGFFIMPLLLLICFTGLVWSYKAVNNSIYYVLDGKLPEKEKEQGAEAFSGNGRVLQQALFAAQGYFTHPGDITIQFPSSERSTVEVINTRPEGIPNRVDAVTFTPQGKVLEFKPHEAISTGAKARRLVFPLHTGSVGGWVTKILYFLASLLAASMPFTGFYIWWGRKNKKKVRKPVRAAAVRKVPAS